MRTTLLLLAACQATEPAPSPCDTDPRAEPLAVGATWSTDGFTAIVDAIDPDPPRVGENTWVVEVVGSAGCALSVAPFMPDHGHGGGVGDVIDEGDEHWRIEAISLRMGGYWEVELVITCDEDDPVGVIVPVCVDA